MKQIYVIFKYEEDNFLKPEIFTNENEAKKRFDELKKELRPDDCDVDEWDEIGGNEISCGECDTLYRLVCEEVDDDVDVIHLYADMENDKYFQIGHTALCIEKQECVDIYDRESNGFVSDYWTKEELEENSHLYDKIVYNEDDLQYTFYTSEYGRYGFCQFGFMCYTDIKLN